MSNSRKNLLDVVYGGAVDGLMRLPVTVRVLLMFGFVILSFHMVLSTPYTGLDLNLLAKVVAGLNLVVMMTYYYKALHKIHSEPKEKPYDLNENLEGVVDFRFVETHVNDRGVTLTPEQLADYIDGNLTTFRDIISNKENHDAMVDLIVGLQEEVVANHRKRPNVFYVANRCKNFQLSSGRWVKVYLCAVNGMLFLRNLTVVEDQND